MLKKRNTVELPQHMGGSSTGNYTPFVKHMMVIQHCGDVFITTSAQVYLNHQQKSRETNGEETKFYAHSYNKSLLSSADNDMG